MQYWLLHAWHSKSRDGQPIWRTESHCHMESTNLGTHHATGISMDKIVPTAPTHLSGEPVLATANDTYSAPSGDLFEEVRQLLLLNQTEHLAQPRTEECRLTVDTDTKRNEKPKNQRQIAKFSSAPLAQGLHRSSDHASLPTHVDSPPRSC